MNKKAREKKKGMVEECDYSLFPAAAGRRWVQGVNRWDENLQRAWVKISPQVANQTYSPNMPCRSHPFSFANGTVDGDDQVPSRNEPRAGRGGAW